MSSAKTILIAHRQTAVRDRFAAALADARHAFVAVDSEADAVGAAADAGRPVSLALVDLGLADDPVAFVRALRRASPRALPIVVFAGSVRAADEIRALMELRVAGYVNDHAATPQILPSLAPHLFPDNFNRRTSPRVKVGIPVSYRSGQTIAGALTLDIGKGGLAIRTMSPLEAGSSVQVKFRLPGSSTDIEAAGRVAWSARTIGMGIQFERLESGGQELIDAYVEEHRL